MLTSEQRAAFETLGYVRVPQAFGRDTAESMVDFVWARMYELHGVDQDDPRTWKADAPWAGLNKFKQDPVFQAVGSPPVRAAIDDLLTHGAWTVPKTWGGFLIEFPDRSPDGWELPVDTYWHVDFHFTYEPGAPFGLRMFSFLSTVNPRGGGTLAIGGSHRLVQRFVTSLRPEERRSGFAVLRDRFNASHPCSRG